VSKWVSKSSCKSAFEKACYFFKYSLRATPARFFFALSLFFHPLAAVNI